MLIVAAAALASACLLAGANTPTAGSMTMIDATSNPTPAGLGGCGWNAASAAYPQNVSGHGMATIGTNIYSFGGLSGTTTISNSYRFNGTGWTPIASLPQPSRGHGVVSDGTSIYIVNGTGPHMFGGTGSTTRLLRYDPVADTYTTLASSPNDSFHAAVVYRNGKIYRIAGLSQSPGTQPFPVTTVNVYDIASNSWTSAANYPQGLAYLAGISLGAYIYAAGGSTGFSISDKSYRYDPISNSWNDAAIADLPDGRQASAYASYLNSFVMAGGFLDTGATNTAISWDQVTNTWSSLPDMPVATGVAGFSVLTDSMYVIAGTDGDVQPADNQKLTCTPGNPTPTPSPTPTATPTPTPTATGAFTVDNTTDNGSLSACADSIANDCSLRGAISKANTTAGSKTIVFDPAVFSTPQTITLASVITINPATGDSLTITGPGANLLTVSGNNAVRIFQISSGDTASISNMTLTTALTGAIDNDGNLTVTNSTFSSNTGGLGGAIANNGASLTVRGCNFTDNKATSTSATGLGGGAIYSNAAAAMVTISDSTFTGNMETGGSGGGGAIRNRTGTMTITNSTFSNNTAVDGGGAIQNSATMSISGSAFTANAVQTDVQNARGGAISNSGELTITDTLVSGNSAFRDGGGIFSSTSASLTITNSTVSNNIANSDSDASGDGGGLSLEGTGQVTISGTTINGNTSRTGATGTAGDGGGIDVTGRLNLTNSTVSGNTSERNGGGIYATGTSGAIVNITSATVVNNTAAADGGGVNRGSTSNSVNLRNTIVANNTDDGTAPDVSGIVTSEGYNLIENTTGTTVNGDTTTNVTGLDPALGSLEDNGGPTATHALLPGSPAIDQGKSFDSTTDQRGLLRVFDYPSIANANGGDGADIGAFELQPVSPKLLNIATRMRVLTGDSALIGGFIVTGNDPKRVIIRGIGPSTNIPGALANPTLELFDANSSLLTSNDDWRSNQAEVEATTIPPSDDLESAIVHTLMPGSYTAVLRGLNNTTGIGVVEVYDLGSAANSTLANISSRGFVDTGDNAMIGGFIVGGGSGTTRVLVRGIGPSLSSFFPNALENPTLELRNADGSLVRENDDWRDSQEAEIQDTTIPPSNDLESAILASVGNGNYTAILRGAGNTTGVGVVEVYNLQ